MQSITNNAWFRKKACAVTLFLVLFSILTQAITSNLSAFSNLKKPKVSLVTSMFIRPGDDYLEQFLRNIVLLENFDECELILIDPNSPQNEKHLIEEYTTRYPNIIYERLSYDPGIYGVWNYAIKKASGEFITNANLDDLRNPEALPVLVKALEDNPEIDLVYGMYYLTYNREKEFNHNYQYIVEAKEFSPSVMYYCLPGPQPLWRKTLHDKYGYFRSDMISSADHEMWNRAVSQGALLKWIPVVTGTFYNNPEGMSTTQNDAKARKRAQEGHFIKGAYEWLWNGHPQNYPKLLIKIPTRSRPEQFFAQLDKYYTLLSGDVPFHFLITCDSDDILMNNQQVIERLNCYPYLTYSFSKNSSKVEAYNRDLDNYTDYDIVLAVGDDMEPLVKGYDKIIAATMQVNFPNFDGVLNFHDGFVGSQCNTYPVVGKNFLKQFHLRLYHPDYKSLYANEELTLVSRALGKEHVSSEVLIKHNHPVYGLSKWDALYVRNENLKERDQVVFNTRKSQNFFNTQVIKHSKLWSILICTLEERTEQFNKLYQELTKQIKDTGLEEKIEVLFIKDNRELCIGAKRNALVAKSQGTYINFVDDDDWISENYISTIYHKLLDNPDCVMLQGIITTRDQDPHLFIHSTHYNNKYSYENGTYYRPPNHLNPIKRSIAVQFPFAESNFGEDKDWSLRIAQSGLIQKESSVESPYYFYKYDGKYD